MSDERGVMVDVYSYKTCSSLGILHLQAAPRVGEWVEVPESGPAIAQVKEVLWGGLHTTDRGQGVHVYVGPRHEYPENGGWPPKVRRTEY